jgi:hypothetical protein
MSQGWFFRCIDPTNMQPYSTPYGINIIENDLVGASMGGFGTVTYGGQNGPCFSPARTLDAAGRFSFFSGNIGTIHSPVDDGMTYTYGAPIDPVGDFGFARITKNLAGTTAGSALFGDGGLRSFFIGASRRYIEGEWADADVVANLRMRVLGDAVRMRWRLTNVRTEAGPVGLMIAAYVGMQAETADSTGANLALTQRFGLGGIPKLTPDGYIGMINLPTGRPVRTERKYTSSSINFPDVVDFAFGQTDYVGMRIENNPSTIFQDASATEAMIIADYAAPGEGSVIGQFFIFGNGIRQSVFGDATGLLEEADLQITETAFMQKFAAQTMASGESREIVHYIRSVWSNGDYRDPYTVVVDAPQLIGANPAGVNGLDNNPTVLRVYIDNQFAEIDKEVALQNMRIRLTLGNGIALAAGQPDQEIIPSIGPNLVSAANFDIVASGTVAGDIPYTVTVTGVGVPSREIKGIIKVATTPRIARPAGPNMVGFPFTFTDNSLNAILGLQAGIDYQAFRWEPSTSEYVPVATPMRGQGYWLVLNTPIAQNLIGASIAEDAGTGGLMTTLKRGWNLVSNPYNYQLKLGDINFIVAGTGDGQVITFTQAVASGIISGGLAFFTIGDDGVGFYDFINDSGSFMEPTRAYWLYCDSFDEVTISWPPIFTPGLPDSGRSQGSPSSFEQSDRQWRLQLTARSKDGVDSRNFLGAAADPKVAEKLDVLKPPSAPGAPFALSIKDQFKGQTTRMAQALVPRSGKMSWNVELKAEKAGEITLNWPNLASLPKNLRFRVTDAATGTVRDMRTASGYTFNMAQPGTREFTVTAEAGGATRALIGNVSVGRAGREVNGPVSINYALSGDATVTVRILSNTGREVFTLSRGRSESAGENSVTWLLRDNANRAVAPGSYRAEIIAESPSGERVRKFVPINVIR